MRGIGMAAMMMAAGALAGCSHGGKGRLPVTQALAEQPGATIVYHSGACYGSCPVYTVTVHADGKGTFEGKENVAQPGSHDFEATLREVNRFQKTLAPYRPQPGQTTMLSGQNCSQMATDMPSVDVRWQSPDGKSEHLHYYYGCDAKTHRKLAKALKDAPMALPIHGFIQND